MRQLRPHYRLTHLDLSNCQQITDDGLKHLKGMHKHCPACTVLR